MFAVRENRYMVLNKDFNKAYKQVVKKDNDEFDFYKWFGTMMRNEMRLLHYWIVLFDILRNKNYLIDWFSCLNVI